jgi:hypothetical protein
MKCICGYDEYQYNDFDEIIGKNEDFIRSDMKISFETDGNYYKQNKVETVWICPKCGTLKIYMIIIKFFKFILALLNLLFICLIVIPVMYELIKF